jgi:hypothetical protein
VTDVTGTSGYPGAASVEGTGPDENASPGFIFRNISLGAITLILGTNTYFVAALLEGLGGGMLIGCGLAHLRQRPLYRWTKGRSCTNFQYGPLEWGCSVRVFPHRKEKKYYADFARWKRAEQHQATAVG